MKTAPEVMIVFTIGGGEGGGDNKEGEEKEVKEEGNEMREKIGEEERKKVREEEEMEEDREKGEREQQEEGEEDKERKGYKSSCRRRGSWPSHWLLQWFSEDHLRGKSPNKPHPPWKQVTTW